MRIGPGLVGAASVPVAPPRSTPTPAQPAVDPRIAGRTLGQGCRGGVGSKREVARAPQVGQKSWSPNRTKRRTSCPLASVPPVPDPPRKQGRRTVFDKGWPWCETAASEDPASEPMQSACRGGDHLDTPRTALYFTSVKIRMPERPVRRKGFSPFLGEGMIR